MARSRPQGVDYLRVYPGLNDFGDALEAIPAEAIKHLTHLKEIDAKGGELMPALIQKIKKYLSSSKHTKEDVEELQSAVLEIMPCLEEKMHVATVAAEAMSRHIARVDTDFSIICDHEIPQIIQIDPRDPALQEFTLVPTSGNQRSGARREAIAARKAAAAAASAAESSRASTPVAPPATSTSGRGGRRGRAAAAVVTAPIVAPEPVVAHENTRVDTPEEKLNLKRRREEDRNETETVPRRRRNPPPDEPTYCYCDQGSYGDMVACDGPECRREWFHLGCIGLSAPPKGQWFCEECQARYRRR